MAVKSIFTLCRRGADTKAEDFEGRTAAHLAAAEHKIGVLAVLLEVGTHPAESKNVIEAALPMEIARFHVQ